MRAFEEVALDFATALVARDFERAAAMLAPSLRQATGAENLRSNFYQMFRAYSDGEASGVQFDSEFSLEDWPAKESHDVGWAYVSVEGEGFVEGVSLVIADVQGDLLIRHIEWGRP